MLCFNSRPEVPGVLSFEPGEGGRSHRDPGQRQGVRNRQGDGLGAAGTIWPSTGARRPSRPGQTTRVDVRFEAVGEETRVTVEHTGWDSVPAAHVARHRLPGHALFAAAGMPNGGKACWRLTSDILVHPRGRDSLEPSIVAGRLRQTRRAPPPSASSSAATLINAVSFGIMIPILPNLIKQFTGGDTAAASEWNVLFSTTWGAMQFLVGPVSGHAVRPLSDAVPSC